MRRILPVVLFVLLTAAAAMADGQVPTRYGAGLTLGQTYDPNADRTWLQGSLVALFDYDTVWPHRAPEPLRFKVEGHVGSTLRKDVRAMVSVNMLAQYYLNALATGTLRPYVDAGIGVIYTDFQVDGQGLRFNFNPQIGLGTDFEDAAGHTWYAGLRAHHVSNGGLNHNNRGINSVTFTVGRYF